mgnify:CR=1 FL=1
MHVNQSIDVGATGVNITTSGTSSDETIPNNAAGELPKYCLITATAACYVRWGVGAQTAVTTDMLVPANVPLAIKTHGADTIAAIQVSSGGTLNVTPLEWSR